jgi:outer membrane protein assembly factor BamB
MAARKGSETMRSATVLCLWSALVVVAAGCSDAPSGGDLAADDILGAWAGTMTLDGEEEPIALELESAEGIEVALWLTVPAMNLSRLPAGSVEPEVEGRQITLGPFVFTHDPEADALSGTMPASMVPVYEMPVTLHRVEAVEPYDRPALSAPLVEPAWTFDAGAPAWAGPTLADATVFAGDDAGRLHALDAATGKERWSFEAGGAIRTRATIADGAVYFQADDGILYRLDAASGTKSWQTRVMDTPVERLAPTDPGARYDNFGSDVTVAEGRLFLGTHDGRVLAVDPADGTVQWEFEADGSVLAAPAVADGRVVFGAFGGRVYALEADTGKPIWETDTKGAVLSTPAVAGDLLIVGNRSYDLLALRAETGEVAWKSYIWFSWVESSATVTDGVAYLGSSDAAAVFAFAADTGERLWESDVFGWSWGQPAVTDQRVFVATAGLRGYAGDAHRGGVVALDRSTGQAVWRYAMDPPEVGAWGFPGSPAVGAGHVFVTGLDGQVLAFIQ